MSEEDKGLLLFLVIGIVCGFFIGIIIVTNEGFTTGKLNERKEWLEGRRRIIDTQKGKKVQYYAGPEWRDIE